MASSRRPQETLFSQRQSRRLAGNQPKAPTVTRPEKGDVEGKEKKRLSVADLKFPEKYDWTSEPTQWGKASEMAVPKEYNRLPNFYAESKPAEQSSSPSPSLPPATQSPPSVMGFPHAPSDFNASLPPPVEEDTSPLPDGRTKRIGNRSQHNSDDEDDCNNKKTVNAKKQRKNSGGSSSSGDRYEMDPVTLQRRQKQIDFGKNTIGYDNYIRLVPRNMRSREDPKTPIKHLKYSRRSWDALILIWRKALHKYDDAPDSVKMEADTNEDQ